MSFLKKAMANVLGVGGAKIDTKIDSTTVCPGGEVRGSLHIYGGSIEQYINNISLGVFVSYDKEVDDKKIKKYGKIQEAVIDINKTIGEKKDVRIPFSFRLHENTPITTSRDSIWVSTNLDIAGGVDSSDRDYINVVPNIYMTNLLDVVGDLGFKIREIENIEMRSRHTDFSFAQEFEFVPTRGQFRGVLDEIEIVFCRGENGLGVLMQVDRRARGFSSFLSESLSLDETNLKINFTYKELQNKSYIHNSIEDLIRKYS